MLSKWPEYANQLLVQPCAPPRCSLSCACCSYQKHIGQRGHPPVSCNTVGHMTCGRTMFTWRASLTVAMHDAHAFSLPCCFRPSRNAVKTSSMFWGRALKPADIP